jgi:putative transposase
LREAAARRGVAVHAYVLMSNHVHLLLTPARRGAVATMLQDVGRKYVRIINMIHERTGTLWEGRYKSSLITDERYLLACHRYIELNPVRAGMVGDPDDFAWSSYRHYARGHTDPLLADHAAYTSLADSTSGRCEAYRRLCADAPSPETLSQIRQAINANRAIDAQVRKRGRPKKPGEHQPPELRNLF